MRIAYISTQARSVDGWGRYTVEVAAGAKARGHEPVLITAHPDLDVSLADAEHHPILPPLFEGRATTLRSLLKAPAVRRVLKTCDVIHVIVELYAPLANQALPPDLPYVLSVFGTWAIRPLESRGMRPFFVPAFHNADRVLSISAFTRDWLARLIDLENVEVLPGGVHPDRFEQPIHADLPEWIGSEPVMFSVGGVKPRKGQHIALDAVALARHEIPDLHYAMAGSLTAAPDYVERLRQRAAELDMSDYVHFLGQLPPYGDLVAWYQNADGFILPSVNQGSSFEGLGFVFLEAGAAGTPSIGTLDCGATEAIIDGETGFLVPQNDPQATAEAVVKLLADENRRSAMGYAANKHAHALSWDRLVDRVLAIYEELTA